MRNKALSQFISAALIIMLSIVSVSIVLTTLYPTIDKAKDSAIIDEGFQNLESIDNIIREVASETKGSKRTINLKVTEGTYRIDSTKDYINFTYNMKEGLDISGQRDNVNITRFGNDINLFIPYNNLDIQGSDHFTKGDNSVLILHNGINPSTNYPKIYIGKSLPKIIKLIVDLLIPDTSVTTVVEDEHRFIVNASVTCEGGNCDRVYGTVRYNYSSTNPDTDITTTKTGKQFYYVESLLWDYWYDPGGSIAVVARDVAIDSANNITLVGKDYTSSADWRIMKFDPNGNSLWNYTYVTANSEEAYGVAIDTVDNITVVGYVWLIGNNYDWRIMKFDKNGNSLWNYTYHKGVSDYAYGVATDSSNNIVVVGYESPLYSDWRIMKFDPDGNSLWDYTYNGIGNKHDRAKAVAIDSNNNIVVVGHEADAGNLADWRIMKFDPNGNSLWNKTINTNGDTGSVNAEGVTTDSNNNIVVVGLGNLDGSYGWIIMKFDPDGNSLWNSTQSVSGNNPAYDVAIDSNDNIFVIGDKSSAESRIMKFDPNGNSLWDFTDIMDRASGVAIDNNDNIIAAGLRGLDWVIEKHDLTQNPGSCVLSEGNTCELTWTITMQGCSNCPYEIGVFFNSSNTDIQGNHTVNATIKQTPLS